MKKFSIGLLTAILLLSAAYTVDRFVSVRSHHGVEAQHSFDRVQYQYNTNLVFTGQDGFYLPGVKISIKDRSGKEVMSGTSDIPMILAALKPGEYTVDAEVSGYRKRSMITVSENLKSVNIQIPVEGESVLTQSPVKNRDDHKSAMKFPG